MIYPLLSIIVSVYNIEKYINQCVDSILLQTMNDYEVLLIDDGSTDSCSVICDNYANTYENVYAFHKKNGGLSDARNFGIKEARGKYLIFIDGDDYYDDKDFFKKISEALNVYSYPNVINFFHKKYLVATNKLLKSNISVDINLINNIKSYEELIKFLVERDILLISACSKVIDRSYLIGKKLFFKTGIVSEDVEWSMRLYSESFTMKFICSDAYIYRQGREGSITSSLGIKNLKDLYLIISSYSEKFLNHQNSIKTVLLSYLAYQYTILCGLTVRLKSKKEKKEILELIKNSKWLLNYNLNPKTKKVSLCNRFFGIKFTCTLLGFYINHRSIMK